MSKTDDNSRLDLLSSLHNIDRQLDQVAVKIHKRLSFEESIWDSLDAAQDEVKGLINRLKRQEASNDKTTNEKES